MSIKPEKNEVYSLFRRKHLFYWAAGTMMAEFEIADQTGTENVCTHVKFMKEPNRKKK